MRGVVLFVLIAFLLLSALAVAPGSPRPAAAAARQLQLLDLIERYQEETWRWQHVMQREKTPAGRSAHRTQSREYRRWVLRLWRERARRARSLARRPPQLPAWLCIHHHEGAWNANTGNGYYGGFQMDLRFQRRYGRRLLRQKGTADLWTPLEQIWVAVRAHRSGRGYYPWPNTARRCGLI